MSTATGARPGVGEQLREWRVRRRFSQLELSNRAEISTRHLSFVETARSAPSREMLLRLAEHLDVPLRERNHLLLAGGFAPVYPETGYAGGPLAAVREALRRVLRAHEPFPAVVVDRWWNLLEANTAIGLFTANLPSASPAGTTGDLSPLRKVAARARLLRAGQRLSGDNRRS